MINQFVSTDGWSTMMYNLMDIDNFGFALIYSLAIIILGNFFIMNLILAVIFDTFVFLKDEEEKLEKFTKNNHPQIDVSDNSFITEISNSLAAPSSPIISQKRSDTLKFH